MNMTPFKLTLSLATPFYMTHRMTLDALLSAAVFRKTGLMDEEALAHIPLAQDQGIFRGSSIFYDKKYQHVSVDRVMALRGTKDLSVDVFAPNARNKKNYVFIDRQRDDYKINMSTYAGIASPRVYFYGVGDLDQVKTLVENYIMGIGIRSNAGAGEVLSVRISPIDQDYSWITPANKPARPLPNAVWLALGMDERGTIPLTYSLPYWGSAQSQCVFPDELCI